MSGCLHMEMYPYLSSRGYIILVSLQQYIWQKLGSWILLFSSVNKFRSKTLGVFFEFASQCKIFLYWVT